MKIELLNKEQITTVYNTMMVNDFPPMELKPLRWILEGYDQGKYSCYALVDDGVDLNRDTVEDSVLGYAIFVKMDRHYLFDYLAVSSGKRNGGLGSAFLQLLRERFADCDSVIGEVEDPECAESEEERELQTRRLNFYLRNGYVDTGVKVIMFGVDYIVLEMDFGKNHDSETIAELYQAHYREMLPEELFLQKVKIK